MKLNLEPAKDVLRSFLSEIEKAHKIRQGISKPIIAPFNINDRTPDFSDIEFEPAPDDYWDRDEAYIWLYAEVWNCSSLMHRPKPYPIPDYYYQAALPLYQQWRQESKEVFQRKCELIPLPSNNVSLFDYLNHLALTASEGNEHRDVWIESLRSFIQFLRDDTELDQKGPLESLFPSQESCKGMEFRKNHTLKRNGNILEQVECRSILRRIEDTVFPVDYLATSEILMNLSKAVLEGRRDSQRSAAIALGFAWLCLAVGSYRLMTREKLVFSTELNGLRVPDIFKREPFKPSHFIGIKSLYGVIDVPISKTLHEFLLALPRDPGSIRIFDMDWETALRTFRNKGVKKSKRALNLGPITFLTFMSHAHGAINHRALLAQKFSKQKKLSPTKQSE